MTDLIVHSRDKVEIPLMTRDADTELVYEFKTKKNDIGFSVRYYTGEGDKVSHAHTPALALFLSAASH